MAPQHCKDDDKRVISCSKYGSACISCDGKKGNPDLMPIDLDRPHEECGVFGIYGDKKSLDAVALTYMGLYGLQHRGQESAGIVASDGIEMTSHKGMGLVRQVFDEENLKQMKGHMAIGHVRYSTTGGSSLINAQPIEVRWAKGCLAMAHNGNISNSEELGEELKASGAVFQSSSDTEIIINLIARYANDPLPEAIRKACMRLRGSYSLVMLTKESLIGFRDPSGNRPLCLGRMGNSYIIASESCALTTIGAKFMRDVEPGELIIVDEQGLHSEILIESERRAICSMEYIYFARPDSCIDGIVVHQARKEMGRQLAKESPIDADVVIPVPDSGYSTAIGFSEESGIPMDIGLIVNRYVGRTFIQPKQELRDRGVLLKLNPIESVIKGRRIVIIDDSIVRGTTSGILINMLRDAGAREVHMYVSSPPWKYPCYYGIDVSAKKELIAASHEIEEIRRFINADSLHYLSLEGLCSSIPDGGNSLCVACFTGEYHM